MYNSFNNPKLKFKKRLGIYSNSTGTNTFDPDTIEAVSYNWWTYVKVINGLVVFNDYNYSPSTSSHQSICKSVMRELNIKIDLYVDQRQSLDKGIDLETLYREAIDLQIQGERKGRTLLNALHDLNESEFLLSELSRLESTIKTRLTRKDKKRIELEARESEKSRLEQLKRDRAKLKPRIDALKPQLESVEPVSLFNELTNTTEINI